MDKTTSKMEAYNYIRKQQVNDKKELVLQAALELFLNNDIVSISMIDIAKAAGIGRATLYRYYDDKEEIVFILASRMMAEIRNIAFKNVSFNTTEEITVGYKNMVSKFNELMYAYRYMAMFDAIYTRSHERTNIYTEQFEHIIREALKNLTDKEIVRHVMILNLIMDFLEDLALHKNLIPLTQGISVEVLLEEFYKTIDSIMQI